MNNRPRRTATPTRPRIERRFPRPRYRPPRLAAPSRRIFPRRVNRPAFQRRLPKTFDSWLSLGITLGLIVILGTAITVFESVYSGRVNPHISVGGIDLGGVSLTDAPSYLEQHIAARDRQPIILHVGDRSFTVTSSQFHARYSVEPALAQALANGHNGDLFTRLWDQVQTMVRGRDYPISGTHDQGAAARYLSRLDAKITIQPLPALVGVRNGQVTITREPVSGQRLDLPAANRLLAQVLNAHRTFDVQLPVQVTASPVTHDVAMATVNQGQQVLSQPTYFSSGTRIRHWFLSPDQLARLLTFTTTFNQRAGYAIALGIDQQRLRETMAPIAAAVDHAPAPAYYIVAVGTNGQPDSAVPQPGLSGLAIDTDKTAQLILAAAQGDHTVTIPLIHPQATFTLAQARQLSFDTELAKGPADLAGSSPARFANAAAAGAALDNIRLAPGQTLSITGVISPVVALNGYKPDLNQSAASDIAGVNGGATQVASAIFQAAYAAGLPIAERAAYPYITSFDGPIGSDAMVVARPSGPDLRIVNNTAHQLLFLIALDKQAGLVTAYLFTDGQVVHRTVKVAAPAVTVNQDGSVDAVISRTISGDTSGQDAIASHYDNLDPYP